MPDARTQTEERFRLAGFIDSGMAEPGFLSATFQDADGHYYLSNTAENRLTIASFVRADVDNQDVILPPASLPTNFVTGDEDVFAFKDVNGHLDAGSKSYLAPRLTKKFRFLSKYPFTQLEIAGFLNNTKLLSTAIRSSIGIELSSSGASAARTIGEIARKFGIDEWHAKDILTLDFARALTRYYNLFHRVIAMSDGDMRRRLTYRFRIATQNIAPFLLDSSLFDIIIDRRSLSMQFYLPSSDLGAMPKEFALQSLLTRVGVSNNLAKRYVEDALSRSDVTDRLRPPTAEEAASAIFSLKTLHFRSKYIEFAVDRLDKKRIKRELDSEFRDLVFGIAVILSCELRTVNIDAGEYLKVKSALSRSIQKLGNLE